MEASTIVMMVLILGIVWGGFGTLLAYGMKAERRRAAAGRDSGAAPNAPGSDDG